MADIWPIENSWAILKARFKEAEPKTKKELKKVIAKVWKEMNKDKALCRNLVTSIPTRL